MSSARVAAAHSRSTPAANRRTHSFGPLTINVVTHRATLDGDELALKPREFDLLAFFMQHPGRAWTRSQLLSQVWGDHYDGDDRTVDLHVARLRSAIEENPRDPKWIETVWRVGYRFREDEP